MSDLCQVRVSYREVSYKSVRQECLTRVSSKSVLQECQVRSVLQKCQVRVSYKSVK